MKQFLRKLVLCVVTLALCCNLVPMAFAADKSYYNIYLDPQGGVCDIMQTAAYKMGSTYKVTSLPTPTLDGYRFDGWYTDEVLGDSVGTGTEFSGDTTIYAHWTPDGVRTSAETTAEETSGPLNIKNHLGTILVVGVTAVVVAVVVSQTS